MMKMKLTCEELTKVTTEIERILNNCPLTYKYDNEVEKVLTQAHLCYGRGFLNEPDDLVDDEQIPEILEFSEELETFQKNY